VQWQLARVTNIGRANPNRRGTTLKSKLYPLRRISGTSRRHSFPHIRRLSQHARRSCGIHAAAVRMTALGLLCSRAAPHVAAAAPGVRRAAVAAAPRRGFSRAVVADGDGAASSSTPSASELVHPSHASKAGGVVRTTPPTHNGARLSCRADAHAVSRARFVVAKPSTYARPLRRPFIVGRVVVLSDPSARSS